MQVKLFVCMFVRLCVDGVVRVGECDGNITRG